MTILLQVCSGTVTLAPPSNPPARCYDCVYSPMLNSPSLLSQPGGPRSDTRPGTESMTGSMSGSVSGSMSGSGSGFGSTSGSGPGSGEVQSGPGGIMQMTPSQEVDVFRQCAMLQHRDHLDVSETVCQSSTCFIRRDSNGLIYRGCADAKNLPLNVSPRQNCVPQGRALSVWWFCNGSLCNSGSFGKEDICSNIISGSNPSPSNWRYYRLTKSSDVTTVLPSNTSDRFPVSDASRDEGGNARQETAEDTFRRIQKKAGFENMQPVSYEAAD